MHDPVDAGRSDQQYGRCSLPDTRCNRQVAGRNVVHTDGAIFLGCLSQQTIAGSDGRRIGARGNRVAREPAKLTRFGDVNRTHVGIQTGCKETNHFVAQLGERLVPLQLFAQAHLAGAQPGFELLLAVVSGRYDRGECDENKQNPGPTQSHRQRTGGGTLPVFAAPADELPLRDIHVADHRAQAIHEDLASVGVDDGECGGGLTGAPQVDRVPQFVYLFIGNRLERFEPLLLLRPIHHQAAQSAELVGKRRNRARVRLEIALVPCQQIPALAGFRILQGR